MKFNYLLAEFLIFLWPFGLSTPVKIESSQKQNLEIPAATWSPPGKVKEV